MLQILQFVFRAQNGFTTAVGIIKDLKTQINALCVLGNLNTTPKPLKSLTIERVCLTQQNNLNIFTYHMRDQRSLSGLSGPLKMEKVKNSTISHKD